jgi:tRNA (adenine37-N6)-methyltransferase
VLDIKPYVPWTDAIPTSATGWLASDGALPGGERPADPRPSWPVELSELARTQLDWLAARDVKLEKRIVDALALGPQPHAYRRIKKNADGSQRLAVKEWYARFQVLPTSIVVEAIEPGIRLEERNRSPIQIDFAKTFGG